MSADHTPLKLEVWDGTSLKAWHNAGRQTVAECYVEFKDADGKVNGCNQQKDVAEANARRLAACWNSCEGVPTNMLEEVPGLLGQTVPTRVLRQQHVELREALTFAIRFFDQLTPSDADRMRKVLEKAGGAV